MTDVRFRTYDKAKDEAKLRDWAEKDNRGYGEAFAQKRGSEVYVASSNGEDVLFIRLSRVVRVELIWPPKEVCRFGSIKLARILKKGLFKLAALCKLSGFSELVFYTDGNNLKSYMKGLGFTESDYLTVPLTDIDEWTK